MESGVLTPTFGYLGFAVDDGLTLLGPSDLSDSAAYKACTCLVAASCVMWQPMTSPPSFITGYPEHPLEPLEPTAYGISDSSPFYL
jgi:hypothetical protein